MFSMKRRPGGVLTISIDLEFDVEQRLHVRHGDLGALTTRLVRLFERANLPATWAVADPAYSAATEEILASAPHHEIAILGDATWIGGHAGRTRFARELTRRITGAETRGCAVSTLAMAGSGPLALLDFLVQHRVSAVRTHASAPGGTTSTVHPQSLRFGVWNAVVSHPFPEMPRALLGDPTHRVRRAIRRLSAGENIHWAINGPAILQADSGLAAVERVLDLVTRQRQKAALRIETVRQLVHRISHRRTHPGATSILRKAG
mgnify:FL=1